MFLRFCIADAAVDAVDQLLAVYVELGREVDDEPQVLERRVLELVVVLNRVCLRVDSELAEIAEVVQSNRDSLFNSCQTLIEYRVLEFEPLHHLVSKRLEPMALRHGQVVGLVVFDAEDLVERVLLRHVRRVVSVRCVWRRLRT